jgi:seryl-tRNA synthetase
MGVMVEGQPANKAVEMVNEGKFEEEIRTEKTELSAEELKKLEEERKKLAKEIEQRRAEYEKLAKEIINSMAGKEKGEIKAKLREAKIPAEIIDELMPAEGAAPAGEAAAPAEGAAEEAKPEEKKE